MEGRVGKAIMLNEESHFLQPVGTQRYNAFWGERQSEFLFTVLCLCTICALYLFTRNKVLCNMFRYEFCLGKNEFEVPRSKSPKKFIDLTSEFSCLHFLLQIGPGEEDSLTS